MPDSRELLYDHYKDSYQQILSHLSNRDRYFIVACLLLFASMFATFNPAYLQGVTRDLSLVKLGFDLELAFYAVNSIFTFISLWYIVRYYQTILIIENLYRYIYALEVRLSDFSADFEISREGKSYLDAYPMLNTCIHNFYFVIFPLLVVSASLLKIYWEVFKMPALPAITLVWDILALSAIIFLTFLYIAWIHFHDFKEKFVKEVTSNGI